MASENDQKPEGMTDKVARMVKPMQIDLGKITRTKSILNANQVQKIFNTTNAKYKYTRPAKGGGVWQYVRTSYIRRTLDGIFGFNWDFEIMTPDDVAFQMAALTGVVSLRGRLTCRTKDDNGEWHTIVREQYGRAEVKWQMEGPKGSRTRKIDDWTGKPIPLDFGNDLKGATSDALKKCAAQLGIAADVYDPDEFIAYEVEGSDEASARAKNTKELAKAAKDKTKLIQSEGTEVDDGKSN